MDIRDAMKRSRKCGACYSRRNGSGWIKYVDKFMYKLSAGDLMGDDWVPATAESKLLEKESEGE